LEATQAKTKVMIPNRVLAGDAVIVVVVDRPDTMAWVIPDDLTRWKTTLVEIFPIAVSNLAARRGSAPSKRAGGGPALAEIPRGDEYTATRVLVPEVQRQFATLLGGPVLFAIPARDRLLAARRDDAAAVAALRAEAARVFAASSYPISAHLVSSASDGTFQVVP
jgi:hypothetical protein